MKGIIILLLAMLVLSGCMSEEERIQQAAIDATNENIEQMGVTADCFITGFMTLDNHTRVSLVRCINEEDGHIYKINYILKHDLDDRHIKTKITNRIIREM